MKPERRFGRLDPMTMQRYRNQGRTSGVVAYELGEDFIDVKFVDGAVYRYTARRPGPRDLARMKELAQRGEGLSTFISRHVWARYDSKCAS
jgi:hypothetical protein